MKRAIRVRKILGGGMRQIGFMAAAALYALDNNVNRLSIDHNRAKEIASVLQKSNFVKKLEPTETNIIIFYLKDAISENKFLADLEKENIRISNMGQGKLRIVTHLDYTNEMHDKLITYFNSYRF